MTTTLSPLASLAEEHPASDAAGKERTTQPLTRNELMASACEKLGETARRIDERQAKLRHLRGVH